MIYQKQILYLKTEDNTISMLIQLQRCAFFCNSGSEIVYLIPNTMKNTVFWDMMPCSMGEIHHCFCRTCCLHVQGRSSTLSSPFFLQVCSESCHSQPCPYTNRLQALSLIVLPPNTENFKKIPTNTLHYNVKFLHLKHCITPTCFNPNGSSSGSVHQRLYKT